MISLYICTIEIVATKIPRPSERKKTVKHFRHELVPMRLTDETQRISPEDTKRYMVKFTELEYDKYTFEYKISDYKFSSKIMKPISLK